MNKCKVCNQPTNQKELCIDCSVEAALIVKHKAPHTRMNASVYDYVMAHKGLNQAAGELPSGV